MDFQLLDILPAQSEIVLMMTTLDALMLMRRYYDRINGICGACACIFSYFTNPEQSRDYEVKIPGNPDPGISKFDPEIPTLLQRHCSGVMQGALLTVYGVCRDIPTFGEFPLFGGAF